MIDRERSKKLKEIQCWVFRLTGGPCSSLCSLFCSETKDEEDWVSGMDTASSLSAGEVSDLTGTQHVIASSDLQTGSDSDRAVSDRNRNQKVSTKQKTGNWRNDDGFSVKEVIGIHDFEMTG
jgi:hypothetical protein